MGNQESQAAAAWFGEGPDNEDPNDNLTKNLSKIRTATAQLYTQNIVIGVETIGSSLTKSISKTENSSIDVKFSLNDTSEILSFDFNYNNQIISGDITHDGYSKSSNLISVEKTENHETLVTCVTNDSNSIVFQFLIEDFVNLSSIKWLTLRDPLQSSAPTECSIDNSLLNKLLTQNNNLKLKLFAYTDNYGLNLGELGGIVTANKSYPNEYPKELIGKCVKFQSDPDLGIQTFYNFRPKLNKVLKGSGDTLLAQTNDINSIYDTGLTECQFYLNIIAYSTYRYMLAGLSDNGNFSCKWLYANNYKKFLKNLRNSEFSAAIVIFTKPQQCFDFTHFNEYFVNCDHK